MPRWVAYSSLLSQESAGPIMNHLRCMHSALSRLLFLHYENYTGKWEDKHREKMNLFCPSKQGHLRKAPTGRNQVQTGPAGDGWLSHEALILH